jgi:signal transduction histidine kinase
MSCALPNHFQGHFVDDAIVEPPSLPLSELADGLHAMAQPLTILRGAMCALTFQDHIEPASRRYLDMSTKQVDRLCDLMAGMQNLLHAMQTKNKFASFDLMELLDPILEQQQAAACESGVQIAVTKPEHPLYVFGEEQGVEQACSAALKAAIAFSHANDRLEVQIAPHNGFASLTLRNEGFNASSRGKNLGSFERFYLTVIESIIRSQCGVYEFTDIPFSMSLHLRISDEPGLPITSDCLQMTV